MAKLVSFLYKLARVANDVETLSSGSPKRIAKRAKNKVRIADNHYFLL